MGASCVRVGAGERWSRWRRFSGVGAGEGGEIFGGFAGLAAALTGVAGGELVRCGVGGCRWDRLA